MNKLAEKIVAGEGQARDNLLIFPLFLSNGEVGPLDYLLLDEALEMWHIEVKELTEEGNVNTYRADR